MVGGRASGGGSGYTAAASSRPQRLAERKWTWEPPSAGRGWQPRQPPDVGGEGGETLGPRRQRETWVGGRDEGEGDTSAPAASPSEVAAAVAAHLRSLAGHNRRACRRVVAAAGHEGAKQIFLANVGALHRGEAFLEQAGPRPRH